MVLDVALVGTGGVMPLPDRWLSSVLLRHAGRLVLFDCGEGTQISLRALRWGPPGQSGGAHLVDLDAILVSHLHADHLAGLPGLLLTLGNLGRTRPVRLLGPVGLADAVARLRVVAPSLPFALRCRELRGGERFALGNLRGRCEAAAHQVPCLAFRLDVPRRPRFLPDRARALGVPTPLWSRLQAGRAVEWSGRSASPREVLGPPRRGLSVAMVTDSRPTPALARLARGVDLLVCEGTFGAEEDAARAAERCHMTFREAATLARDAAARRLVLTHFSPAMPDPTAFAEQATRVFPGAVVGRDHLWLRLAFADAAEG